MKIKQQCFWILTIASILFIARPPVALGAAGHLKHTLFFGGSENFPPYQFLDEQGRPAGFDVELVDAIAKVMGLNAEIHLGSRDQMNDDLAQGKIDILIDRQPPRDAPEPSNPVTKISYSIFVRKGDHSIYSEKDLVNKKVIIQRGDLIFDYSTNNFPACQLVIMDSPADALRALAAGEYDCSLQARSEGLHLIKARNLINIKTVGLPILEIENIYAVTNGTPSSLEKIFREGLHIVRQTGQYQALYDKWIGSLEPNELSLGKIVKYVAFSLIPILLLLAGAVGWSWALKKQVAQKTRALKKELTERIQAQEALRESEQKYRLLIDNIDLGITLINANHKIVMANPAQRRLFNGSVSTIIEETCRCLVSVAADETDWGDGENEMPVPDLIVDRVLEANRDDGTPFPIRIQVFPIVAPDHRASGFIAVVEDISERWKAEEREKRRTREIFTLLNSLPGYAFYKDKDSVYITVNKKFADALGLKQEEFAGKTDFDIMPPELADKYRSYDRQVIESGEVHDINTEHFLDNRNPIIVATRRVPLKDDEGRVTGLIGLAFDITAIKQIEDERLKMEAQLQQTQKLESLGILAGGIAHDFNNLLMVILGYADLALVGMPRPSLEHDFIGEIKKAGIRASELTKQMLAYSGRGKFTTKAINLNELIDEMTNLLRVSISKKVVINFNLMKQLPLIEADGSQIRQVVMNLITNASDAIGDQIGVISLTTGLRDLDPRNPRQRLSQCPAARWKIHLCRSLRHRVRHG